MSAVYFDSDMTDEERRARLYAGDIFIFSPTEASRALAKLARQMLEEGFHPKDPRSLHREMDVGDVVDVLAKLKPQFIHHPECKKLIPQIMNELNVDPDKLYFDVPRLRSAYPKEFLSAGIAYAFHPHRDTWYSAPMCQVNWWMPIYPIEPHNAMNFYPRHFDEAIRNTSDTYNYYEWNEKSRASAAKHVTSDTRQQPKAVQDLDPVKVCFIPPPASLIVFSGAHLHETVPNLTDVARYSIDFRTVFLDDVELRKGAHNVDSRCTGTTMRDYLRASDLSHLPNRAIDLYEDGSAAGERVLEFGDQLAR